jgi:hypothetical protein
MNDRLKVLVQKLKKSQPVLKTACAFHPPRRVNVKNIHLRCCSCGYSAHVDIENKKI